MAVPAGITEDDRSYMHKFSAAIRPDEAMAWVVERLENCVRHAAKHEGDDKRRWLEDAAFFAAIAELLQQVPKH